VIVFDIHVMIWWADADRLSPETRAAIEEEIEPACSLPCGRAPAAAGSRSLGAATRLQEPFHVDLAERFLVAQAQ